jgi:hypothetical protein
VNKQMKYVETVRDGDKILAIIVFNNFAEQGIHFFTPPDLSQQLASPWQGD